MTKNQKRDIATSVTSSIFLVIGVTGVLMYFHIFDAYTKDMHEILGLVFIVAVLFHVIFNWKSMKSYFKKNIFLSSLLGTFIIVLGFIFTASSSGESPKKTIIKSVFKAPINDSIRILGTDIETVKVNFKKSNIKFNDEKSIIQIAKKNKVSPFKVVKIIVAK